RVVAPEVEAGSAELNVVLGDLVAKQPAGRTVAVQRHGKASGKVADPRDDDQRHLMLTLSPTDPAHLVVGDEYGVGPDAVLVETASDLETERQQVRVVDEHHPFTEGLPPQ